MDPNKRKPINKLRIKNFFENRKRTQKIRAQLKEETDQLTENLKRFFEIRKPTQKKRKLAQKRGNRPQKKEETDQQNENLKRLLKTRSGPKK